MSYKHYKLPFEYGWMALGSNGTGGGGGTMNWWGPPLDYFFPILWWVTVFAALNIALFSSACH
jgi:hypothetical protein